jgi:EmrB/QacA subfamily drug resistance transporter
MTQNPTEQPLATRPVITRGQWYILGTLMLGVFMGALDISIVSPALPVIAQKLVIDPRQLSWVVTLYLLVYVVATPLMSAISDRWGRRAIFIFDVLIFGTGSLWAAFSGSLFHLLGARALQALGAGGLFPIASTVVGEVFPTERRGMALGFVGMVWGVAGILGPLAGGWLTQWFGWNSIFYLNLPVALIILLMAVRFLPQDRGIHREPLDIPGMVLLGAGLSSLTYGLNRIQSQNIWKSLASTTVWPWLAGALALLALFVLAERRPKAPVIALSLFGKRQINISLVLSFARGMTEGGLVFLPFFAMAALGFASGKAGTLMLVSALTLFIFTEPMGMMVDRVGAKAVLLFGATMTAVGAYLLGGAHTLSGFIGYQVILGIGLSAMSGAPIRYVALAESSDTERAAAQSLISLATSFGMMLSATLAGAFLAAGSTANTVPPMQNFKNIYLLVVAAAAVGFIFSLGLKKRHHQSHHRKTGWI